jgi:2-dehydro-3-deoxyphosphogluconate aldolase/(4S)-4-hydroxy-2-oxoglutarate aldolase
MGDLLAERLTEEGVVAILRANSAERLVEAADAVLAGGVSCIEVALTTPGALDVIAAAVDRLGDSVSFGAGSVLDAATARAAILAGAQFVVAPIVDSPTIEMCRRYGIKCMPGALTPSEILGAWQAGADYVKVFPATAVGGPAYIKAVRAPLPQVRLVAVGGVNLENTAEYIRCGAEVVGIASDLVSQTLLDDGDYVAIEQRARRFREEVDRGRGE